MKGCGASLDRIEAAVAQLRGDAVAASAVAMLDDLDKIGSAVQSLQGQLLSLAERAAHADDEGLRAIRHDLRTPVGQILGYCELLAEEAEDSGDTRWRTALTGLHAEAETLQRCVDALSQTYTGPSSVDTGVHRTTPLVPHSPIATGSHEGPGTVLVVDDSAENRDLLGRRVERDGYRVLTATHGGEALELLRSAEIDVVLLDILMPVMDGYATLAALKADPELRHVPVIMLTSLSDHGSLTACIEAGAEDHLAKPFDPVLLRARLSGSLEKKRARDLERRYLAQIVAEKKRADDLVHGVIPIGVALAGERNEARILERTLAEARRFCGADGGLLLLRERDDLFVVQLQCDSKGESVSPTATRPPTLSGGIPARVSLVDASKARRPEVVAALTGTTVAIDVEAGVGDYDMSAVQLFDERQEYRTRSLVYVPLRTATGDETCGVLQLWNATQSTDGEPIAFPTASVEMLESLSLLAAAALQAYRRETELRQRIRRLEIKIDEKDRSVEVSQITETDYFKQLREQARALRKGPG